MSNWFENNPTKSILSYTLVVAGATWATSTFILQDNRLSLAKSELESQKTLAEQYKAKADLLQKDIEVVRAENSEYRAWLSQSKDAVPIIMPRLTELKTKVAELETEAKQLKSNPGSVHLVEDKAAKVGKAYVDESIGLIVTVQQVSPAREAQLILQFPDRSAPIQEEAPPGKQWKFKSKDTSFQLTLTEIDFYRSEVKFRVSRTQ